jgi:hypothetical protein
MCVCVNYFLEKGGGGMPMAPTRELPPTAVGGALLLLCSTTFGLASTPGVRGMSSRSSSSLFPGVGAGWATLAGNATGMDASTAAGAKEALANCVAVGLGAVGLGAVVTPNNSVADRGVAAAAGV